MPRLEAKKRLGEPSVRELPFHFENLFPGPYPPRRRQIAQIHGSGAYSETQRLFVTPSSGQAIKHPGAE
jgi:hypothetical protein